MNQPNTSAPKQIYRGLVIMYLSMSLGVFIFLLIAYFFNRATGAYAPDLFEDARTLQLIVGGITLVLIFLARSNFQKRIKNIDKSLPLTEKLKAYTGAFISSMAITEAPALLGIILFILSGDFVLFAFAALALSAMLMMAPVKSRVIDQLDLGYSEAKQLDES